MKNFFIFLGLLLIFGIGCESKTESLKQTSKEEVSVSTTTSTDKQKGNFEAGQQISKKVGYYVENNFLWRDGEKLFDKPLELLLYGKENPYLDYGLWHMLDRQNTTRLFLARGGGCEGCGSLAKKYFVVDKIASTIAIEEFQDSELSALFQRGTIDLVIFSPDKNKVAFFSYPDDGNLVSVWVFDFLTGQEEKRATVKKQHNIFTCPEDEIVCHIDSKLLYWQTDPQQLVVNVPTEPIAETIKQEISLRKLQYFASLVPYNNPYPSVHAFDFNSDRFDEYVVYYQKVLPQTVQVGFSETNRNGAFQIFQWKNHEWKVIYEDEGTVGKEGYGVYDSLNQDRFFNLVDLDNDGISEVKISFDRDGTGGYVDGYILKWVDGEIIKAAVINTKTEVELEQLFLKNGEEFGPGDLDYISICPSSSAPNDQSWYCSFRQSAPGAVGRIEKKFEYRNGVFKAISYKRSDY